MLFTCTITQTNDAVMAKGVLINMVCMYILKLKNLQNANINKAKRSKNKKPTLQLENNSKLFKNNPKHTE